jgi:hypothetical protein
MQAEALPKIKSAATQQDIFIANYFREPKGEQNLTPAVLQSNLYVDKTEYLPP